MAAHKVLHLSLGGPHLMRTARAISIAMTVLGLVLAAFGTLLELSPLVTITGMLLFVAGIVKVVMVAVWSSFFAHPVEETYRKSTPAPKDGGFAP